MSDAPFPRRILHVWLPRLATDRLARVRARRRPVAESHGADGVPRATIAKSRGATMLAAVDDCAAAAGLVPGQGLADARALVPALLVDPADPEADAAALDALARAADRYTPLVGRDPPDGLFLDITGCSHLFGGEAALVDTILAHHARAGFAARVAVAGRPSVASAVARHGATSAHPGTVVAEGGEIAAVAPLPVAALRLTEETVAVLHRVGLKTIGDVLAQPRAPLVQRFGPLLARRIDAIEGRIVEPITPVAPVPPVIAERRFAEPVAETGPLEAALAALAGEAARLLARRGEGARTLRLRLFEAGGEVHEATVGASEPIADPARIATLLTPRLRRLGERIESDGGIDLVRLHAAETAPLAPRQTGFEGVEQMAADLARLVDTLSERLGADAVRRFVAADTHHPVLAGSTRPAREVAMTLAAPTTRDTAALGPHAAATVAARATSDGPPLPDWATEPPPARPLRLFTPPEPVEAVAGVPDGPPIRFRWRRVSYLVAAAEGPERIAPPWWEGGGETCDYFRVEDVEGRRFWMLRRGLYGEGVLPRWFVHGLFA